MLIIYFSIFSNVFNLFDINFISIQKISDFLKFLISLAQSLGHAAFVPEKEGYSFTKSQLMAQMDVSMGGRVAEELSKTTFKLISIITKL